MTKLNEIAQWTWDRKYRLRAPDGQPIDTMVGDTHQRVAKAVARAETSAAAGSYWSDRFFDVLASFEFLPAGRIIAGAGSERGVTMFNCFVMGAIPDDLAGIHDALKQAALTMKEGGGIGMDFSTLRPRGALVKSVGSGSSGPVSFMDEWNTMCQTIMSAGARRGAMMAMLRCDHPDVEEFIDAKRHGGRLTNFNVSVACTARFMDEVSNNGDWPLVFNGKTYKTVKARELWAKMMRNTYDFADPGVFFIDRVNSHNPLNYAEAIAACNPCGEQPLPPYGACLLGSINLTKFVREPFTEDANIDGARLHEVAQTAIRFLDNVIDVSHYPLEEQQKEAKAKRRVGLGITGLADMLAMCGHKYGSATGRQVAIQVMENIMHAAEVASEALGEEKGSFPLFDATKFSNRSRRQFKYRRNSHLISIAPTGTISLFAGNISSGIEPIFDYVAQRKLLQSDDTHLEVTVTDYAYGLFEQHRGRQLEHLGELPAHWQRAADLTPNDHLKMVAALQPYVDSAISKTINVPESYSFEDFQTIYSEAYRLGLKGCTTYRPNNVTGSILSSETMKVSGSNVVSLSKPLERAEALDGTTYKLKPPGSEHAMYITINNIVLDGRTRPFEIFINTKNLEHAVWSIALTRMISAIFRKGGDAAFMVDELKAVFDPRGGYYDGGRYVPSIIAGIGQVIEAHMRSIGVLEGEPQQASVGLHCPKCQTGRLVSSEGCFKCESCDYTKC